MVGLAHFDEKHTGIYGGVQSRYDQHTSLWDFMVTCVYQMLHFVRYRCPLTFSAVLYRAATHHVSQLPTHYLRFPSAALFAMNANG